MVIIEYIYKTPKTPLNPLVNENRREFWTAKYLAASKIEYFGQL